jgi:branched-chain amino acid transport system substrate-binding protein
VWAADPVRIGLVAGLTGAEAGHSQMAARGATLAIEEVNRQGGVLGRPMELLSEDNQSTPPGTVVATSKLLADPAVAAIILPPTSAQTLAVLPAIAKRGIPAMVSATHKVFTHSSNPWIFRVRANASYMGRALADFGVGTLKKRKWAIVYATDGFGIDCKDEITGQLKTLGVTPVTALGINPVAQNSAPVVQTIRNSEADIVAGCVGLAPTIAEFAKELRRAGVDAVLMGTTASSAIEARKIAGEALYGAYSISPFVEDASSAAKEFVRVYGQRWNTADDPQAAAWSYDAVHLLAASMNKAGSTSPEAIRAQLLKVKGQVAAGGTFTFDERGDGLHSINIVKNDKGRRVYVQTISYAPLR